MADANLQDFYARTRRIDRHHQRLSRGYTLSMTRDGLLIHKPVRRVSIPARGFVMTIIALWAFKTFLYVYLGPSAYAARVAKLEGGTAIESVGAWLMQADPATVWFAEQSMFLLARLG